MKDWQKRIIIIYSLPIRAAVWFLLNIVKIEISPSWKKLLEEQPLYAVAAALMVAELPLLIATTLIWIFVFLFLMLLLQ